MPTLARCTVTLRRAPLISPTPKPVLARASLFGSCSTYAGVVRFTSSASRRTPRSLSPHRHDEPNVDPNSLAETLEAHREANRTSLIHRIYEDGGKESIVVPSRIRKRLPSYVVRHVDLQKIPLQNRRDRNGPPGGSEYSGISREVSRQWTASPLLTRRQRYPWVAQISEPAASPTDQLNAEIQAFDKYISPDTQEKLAASSAMADLFACIQCAAPSVQIDVIGSRVSGLATPFSDIDLNVAPTVQNTVRDSFTLLGYLAREMRKRGANPYRPKPNPVRVNVFIDHTRVPIVTGHHAPTGLEFQIQSYNEGQSTLEYTRAFLSEYPTLRALFLVLKQMLKMRSLSDGSQGGLTTYPLIGMIVAALKFSEGKFHKDDVGQQLLFFIDMYADIDFYKTAISISPLEHTTEKIYANPARPFLMSLQDPANVNNDLGRGVYMIKHIQATLVTARERIHEAMRVWEERGDNGAVEQKAPAPILGWLLGGDYRVFEHERQEMRNWKFLSSRPVNLTDTGDKSDREQENEIEREGDEGQSRLLD